jgi:release factor glutamine methyltransferase
MDPEGMTAAVAERLRLAGCVAAEEEAVELLSAAADAAELEHWLRRRENGEPLGWIVGAVTFCGRALLTAPRVYVPRTQSEELARRAAGRLPARGRALDLCTGIGAIAAHLRAAVPTATVVATDIDPRAAACARRNGVAAVVGDLDACIRPGRRWDLVTAVAPYVPTGELQYLPRDVVHHEPRTALDGGADGLDLLRRVVAGAGRLLRPGGWLVVELGGAQAAALSPTLAGAGFESGDPWHDDDGDQRGIEARRG